jgi:hypothetical protein
MSAQRNAGWQRWHRGLRRCRRDFAREVIRMLLTAPGGCVRMVVNLAGLQLTGLALVHNWT